jgi:hypothetical protein
MAMPYTLTLQEAKARLRELVVQSRATHRPVILTMDETAEPLALLSPLSDERTIQADSIAYRLETLEAILQAWEESLDEPDVWQEYARLFHTQLRLLSQTAPDDKAAFGPLVILLRLATRQLYESVSGVKSTEATKSTEAVKSTKVVKSTKAVKSTKHEQLRALQRGIEALQSPALTFDHIREVDQALCDSGLQARADFSDEELLCLYVQAL